MMIFNGNFNPFALQNIQTKDSFIKLFIYHDENDEKVLKKLEKGFGLIPKLRFISQRIEEKEFV
jgi:hypothetical protein